MYILVINLRLKFNFHVDVPSLARACSQAPPHGSEHLTASESTFKIILNSEVLSVTAELERTMAAKHSLIANEDIVEQLELNEME